MSLVDLSSLLDADHAPLRSSQVLVDTALEEAEAELSNAVSMSAWNHTMASGWRSKVNQNLQAFVVEPLRGVRVSTPSSS